LRPLVRDANAILAIGIPTRAARAGEDMASELRSIPAGIRKRSILGKCSAFAGQQCSFKDGVDL
jgi:hypothetical protein